MAAGYFIRIRGRKSGPHTVEQLHSLGKRGRFGRHYEVSRDGKIWQPAADFPELFVVDEDLEDDFGDPMEDPPPRRGRRGRGASRGDDDDYAPPPPVDFDDMYSDEPAPAERRSRGRRRSAAQETRESLPLADGPADDGPLDEPAPAERPSRSRRRGRSTRREADDVDAPLWEADDDPPPRARAKAPEDLAPIPVDDVEVKPKLEAQDVTEKKSGGILSWFRRKDKGPDIAPHLQHLKEMAERLGELEFEPDDMTLIGARQQELPVIGHHDDGDGIQTLGMLIMIAYQTRSTDIHLEPKAEGCDARMRVDGMLIPVVPLPADVASRVGGVVKVLCQIDFAGIHGIQEGSFSARAPGRFTDFRVSFTPSVHGQKLAIRILDVANSPQSLKGLGAPKRLLSKLQGVMQQNSGMILMCGPTGSGKTTTLYSLIRDIDRNARNVMTIEDPVEYQIEGVTQSSVDASRGKNFSDMLRALLRQDPDVILLGEIRDAETARVAMQATMTGHLVLSTVHAQDTVNTVFRLLDLGADPNLVASSLDLVLAQRLIRVLCPQCRKRRRPNADELERLGRSARDMIYESTGCDRCLGTGFAGRRALFELLETNDRLKEVMLKSPTLAQLKAAGQGPRFMSLRVHGAHLVAQGVTTFAEVDRVIGLGH